MKTKLILLSSILLIVISSFCQENYPNKIILEKDTIVVITKRQLKQINLKLVENNVYKAIIDSTQQIISEVNKNLLNTKNLLSNNSQLIVLLKEQQKTTELKVTNSEKNILNLQNELKHQKKKTVRLAIISGAVSFSGASIFYFITK